MNNTAMKPKRSPTSPYDVLLIMLIVLNMLAIIIARAPYLHDFAEWLYQGQIVRQFVEDAAVVSHFTMATYPVPNSLATALLASLSFILTPLWAGKVFLILMLLGWYGVIRLFTRRFVDAQWRAAATLVLYASFALAPFFWYGFISYQLALILFTWFLASYREQTGAWVIAVFGLAIFFAHAFLFLIFGLFLGVRLLLRWSNAVVAGLVPATVCSLWFLVGSYIAQVEPQRINAIWSGLRETIIYKAGYPAMLGPFKNFLLPDGSSLLESHAWVYWPGFIVNFAVVATLGILVLVVLWSYLKDNLPESMEAPVLRTALAISMTLLVLFYLLAPYRFFGLGNPGGRVLIPLVLMAFMLGWGVARPFVRIVIWPVVVCTFITSGSYCYLMMQTRQPEFLPKMTSVVRPSPSGSVFDFNKKLYSSTRYKYFNYRVFAFSRRFEQIESGQFRGLSFRHGMLIKFQPENKTDGP